MKRILVVSLFMGAFLLVSNKPIGSNTSGVSDYLIQSTLWYQASPEMQALYIQGFNVAGANLKQHVKSNKKSKKPLAVVVDIDETMLDNSPFEGYLIHKGKSYKPEIWKQWTDLAKAKALPGAVEFTKLAKSLGVHIIYISNRDTTELISTHKNLVEEGFEYASPEYYYFKTTTSSKDSRRKLVQEKYNIIMLIGDNLSDFNTVFDKRDGSEFEYVKEFSKEFGKSYIILPNPTYGDWEKPIVRNAKNEEERYLARKSRVIGF